MSENNVIKRWASQSWFETKSYQNWRCLKGLSCSGLYVNIVDLPLITKFLLEEIKWDCDWEFDDNVNRLVLSR